jgi:hypothetical protein
MPTDSKEMKYSKKYHMYLLDVENLKSDLGLDFVARDGSLTKAKDTMYKLSRTVYQFIYGHTRYKKELEYWLAKDEELRPIILQVLEEQARYEFETNAEYLSIQSGVNLLNGVRVPLKELRGLVRVAPAVEEILRNTGLLYQGQRFIPMPRETFDYETGDY